jgi:hypothetical protein
MSTLPSLSTSIFSTICRSCALVMADTSEMLSMVSKVRL